MFSIKKIVFLLIYGLEFYLKRINHIIIFSCKFFNINKLFYRLCVMSNNILIFYILNNLYIDIYIIILCKIIFITLLIKIIFHDNIYYFLKDIAIQNIYNLIVFFIEFYSVTLKCYW